MHAFTSYAPLPRTQIEVLPGNAEIIKGDSLKLTAIFKGEIPEKATLLVRKENRSVWEEDLLTRISNNEFSYIFKEVKKSFAYYIKSAGCLTKEYEVIVINRPVVKKLKWTLVPPSYTRLSKRIITENIKQVEILVGTRILLELESNKELERAWLVWEDARLVKGKVDKKKAFLRSKVFKNREFFIKLKDTQGIENEEPISYKIAVIKDELPQVKIDWPGQDVEAPEKMRLPLKVSLWDDFGFTKLWLIYRINEEKWKKRAIEIPHKNEA
ncbi:unnamed protein product, partial [marine sediment metagenome]